MGLFTKSFPRCGRYKGPSFSDVETRTHVRELAQDDTENRRQRREFICRSPGLANDTLNHYVSY